MTERPTERPKKKPDKLNRIPVPVPNKLITQTLVNETINALLIKRMRFTDTL